MAPVIKGRKGEYQRLFERLRKKGFLRARVNGVLRDLEDDIPLEKNRKHTIEVLVDTIKIGPDAERRLRAAVDKALEAGDGEVLVVDESGKERFFSLTLLCPFCEVSLAELEPRNFSFNSPYGACPKCHGLGHEATPNEWGEVELTDEVCSACGGARLKKESLSVKVGGRNIHEVGELSIRDLLGECAKLVFPPAETLVAGKILKEISSRLAVMEELGMSYLQLNRTTSSLSGGEAQRVRLAAQVGSRLRGVLYVLDEPTIGLHQRDNGRLISLLRGLRDEGNSIVVVEHDEQTIRAADYLLDLGPGAGETGGFKVAEGPLSAILASPDSLTAQYLRGEKSVPIPSTRRKPAGWLTVRKAREHNLKDIDVRIPLAAMTAVTGVSGSGKSTLVYDILFKALENKLYKARQTVGAHEKMEGIDGLDKVVAEPGETDVQTSRGQTIPVSISAAPVSSESTEFRGHILVLRDITDRKRAERRIRYLARFDALTKMPNRMQFQHLLHQAITRSTRQSRGLVLLYVDIDNFKEVNDTFGHAAGDRVLETVSERLSSALPKDAVVGRLAGDEFAIFTEASESEGACHDLAGGLARLVLRGQPVAA